MDQQDLTKIEVLLDKLNLLIADAKQAGKLEEIEQTLAIKYTRQLKKIIEGLDTKKKENKKNKPKKIKAENEIVEKVESPVTEKDARNDPPIEKKLSKIGALKQPDDTPISFLGHDEEESNVTKKPQVDNPVAKSNTSVEKQVTAGKTQPVPKGEGLSLNDQFGDMDDLAAKLKNKPISDLKTGIGLNDKFWFINELFDGKGEPYNDMIDKVNSIGSYTDALTYIEGEVKPNFDWSEKNKTIEKLLKLIYRRYL